MEKKNMLGNILKPAMVLAIVSLVISTALVVVYNLTKKPEGYIDPAVVAQAGEILGESVQPLEVDLAAFDEYNLEAVFKSESGATAVFLWSKGYGGEIHTLVGIDANGEVLNVQITDMMETAGLGDKTKKPEFIGQYIGKSGTIGVVDAKKTAGENEINAISGATISSKAVTLCVNNALEVFEAVKSIGSEVADNG